MNRRDLIKTTAVIAPAALLTPHIEAAELLAVDDPIAVALKYVEDAATVDLAANPKKAGPGGDAQRCSNCTLYKAVNGAEGTCSAIPGKLVKGAGWCSVWAAAG